ncbi:hypothetical protein BRC96_01555 [Halobacteriales archaeon QS_6_64_34]|nr:MAG: hypothetical protein BRC96_01555 [Halobacteriales archaeon QS_6_64_34]
MKARVTARILFASDDATEAVISQADTAGQAVRLWRIQQGIDADVDALPEARQADLGQYLLRNGDPGRQTYNALADVDGDAANANNRQMSDNWIDNRLETLVENADPPERKAFIRRLADEDGPDAIDISERGGEIELNQVNTDNLQKELIAYQDGDQTGELASSGLRVSEDAEPTLDNVEVVKIGDVFEGVS